MHFVPTFLRPLSQSNTGLESRIEDKASKVNTIESCSDKLYFKQQKEVSLWQYEEALEGKQVIEHGRRVLVSKEVEYPDRHWWIISDGLLDHLDPPLRDHADIFDLITAINIAIDDPISFSQKPGQTIGGVYRKRGAGLDYRGDLSPGSFPMALLTSGEIPEIVEVSDQVGLIYKMVRSFRATSIDSDEDMDIRIALHMYDDALVSTIWTAMSNLFFVCENVLCSGTNTNPEKRISEVTDMELEEAENWKKTVNRLKHPDKGDIPSLSLLQQQDLEVPTIAYMRRTTNNALLHEMNNRYRELEGTL